MKRIKEEKCRHCRCLFVPDPRNQDRQKYCSSPACRKASKSASQKKWLRKPGNRDYFKGPENVERIREWRKKNPGYWKRSKPKSALQDPLNGQDAENTCKSHQIRANALQDFLMAQPPVMIGLISNFIGSALQDDIANALLAMQRSGQDILYLPSKGGKHVYVFMTNHYHMIIETPSPNISKVMHFINGSYTTYINKKRDRSGHLFQGRYKAILIDRDNYLLEASRYIHLNSVRARIVEKPEEFLNSSYASYIGKRKDAVVHHDQILQMISKDKKSAQKLYRDFVESGIEGDLENPFLKTYAGSILGEKSFIKEALGRLKEGVVSGKETSHRKLLESTYQPDVIIDGVSSFFGVDNEKVINDRKDYRNICIYIMKKYTGMTNGEIGQIFNGLTFSGVAKVYQRMSKAVDENWTMRKKVRKIISSLS